MTQNHRCTVHACALLHKVDVIALQETGVEDGSITNLRDYQCSHLPANRIDNTRGLLTNVRKNVPLEMVTSDKQKGTEVLCVKVHVHGRSLYC